MKYCSMDVLTKEQNLANFAGPSQQSIAMTNLIESIYGMTGEMPSEDEFACYADRDGVDRVVVGKNPTIELVAPSSGVENYYSIRLEGQEHNLLELGGNFDQVAYLALGDGFSEPPLRLMCDGGSFRVTTQGEAVAPHSFVQTWDNGENHSFMQWDVAGAGWGGDSYALSFGIGGQDTFRVDIAGALFGRARPWAPDDQLQDGDHCLWVNDAGDLLYSANRGGTIVTKTLVAFA